MADYYYEARKHDKLLRRHAKENKVRLRNFKNIKRMRDGFADSREPVLLGSFNTSRVKKNYRS